MAQYLKMFCGFKWSKSHAGSWTQKELYNPFNLGLNTLVYIRKSPELDGNYFASLPVRLKYKQISLVAYRLAYGIECLTVKLHINLFCLHWLHSILKQRLLRSLNWLKADSRLCLGDIGQSGSAIMCVDGEICKSGIRDENWTFPSVQARNSLYISGKYP